MKTLKTFGYAYRALRAIAGLSLLVATILAMGSFVAWGAPPKKRQPVQDGVEKVGNIFFKVARKLEQSGFPDHLGDVEIIYDSRRPSDPESERLAAEARARIHPSAPAPGYRARTTPRATARPYPRNESHFPPGYKPDFQPHPQPRLHYSGTPSQSSGTPSQNTGTPSQSSGQSRSKLSLPVPDARQGSFPLTQQARAGLREIEPLEPPATTPVKSETETAPEETPADILPQASAPKRPEFATPIPRRSGFVYPPGVEHDLKNMLDVRDFQAGQKVKDPRTGQIFLVPPK